MRSRPLEEDSGPAGSDRAAMGPDTLSGSSVLPNNTIEEYEYLLRNRPWSLHLNYLHPMVLSRSVSPTRQEDAAIDDSDRTRSVRPHHSVAEAPRQESPRIVRQSKSQQSTDRSISSTKAKNRDDKRPRKNNIFCEKCGQGFTDSLKLRRHQR